MSASDYLGSCCCLLSRKGVSQSLLGRVAIHVTLSYVPRRYDGCPVFLVVSSALRPGCNARFRRCRLLFSRTYRGKDGCLGKRYFIKLMVDIPIRMSNGLHCLDIPINCQLHSGGRGGLRLTTGVIRRTVRRFPARAGAVLLYSD